MKYTNRADLLIAAGESIKMQESAGIEPVCKFAGTKHSFDSLGFYQTEYEFPLAVVEGKPVFIGDELYNHNGDRKIVASLMPRGVFLFVEGGRSFVTSCSWNPPKPKTVMVELPIQVAQFCANTGLTNSVLSEKCRKALEEVK